MEPRPTPDQQLQDLRNQLGRQGKHAQHLEDRLEKLKERIDAMADDKLAVQLRCNAQDRGRRERRDYVVIVMAVFSLAILWIGSGIVGTIATSRAHLAAILALAIIWAIVIVACIGYLRGKAE